MKEYLRRIPPVHSLQKQEAFIRLSETYGLPHSKLTNWLQNETEILRQKLLAGEWSESEPTQELLTSYLLQAVEKKCAGFSNSGLQRVINGTGVVLHTNLGRARLSEEAVHSVHKAAANYSDLEYDLELGKRGSRNQSIEALIQEVTGAEAAMVVNNNAAAVYLVLRALAKNKDIIVSRGQLVEIGGSFRVSSIMEESDADLVEVGTTNKTHLYDYEDAISEKTAMLMKVHTSNFKITGFSQSVPTEELAELASENQLIFYEDLGSGAFYDFKKDGVGEEPLVSEVLRQGVDIVTCSGDKLLGGPQAGIIAGKKKWLDKLKKHQLARVLRVDKMTMAALETTLKAYVKGGKAMEQIPTVRDIVADSEELRLRAVYFTGLIGEKCPEIACKVAEDESQIGGGTMPDVYLPTFGVSLTHSQLKPQVLANALRGHRPPIITRMKEEQVFLDVRCMTDEEIVEVVAALSSL